MVGRWVYRLSRGSMGVSAGAHGGGVRGGKDEEEALPLVGREGGGARAAVGADGGADVRRDLEGAGFGSGRSSGREGCRRGKLACDEGRACGMAVQAPEPSKRQAW